MSDSILYYTRPAEDFNNALPVGNGRIGGMIYGGTEKEHIGLNEDSIWSGGLRHRVNPDAKGGVGEVRSLLIAGKIAEAEKTAMDKMAGIPEGCRHYMPLGDLDIYFDHKYEDVSAYRRSLDLEKAVSCVEYEHEGVTYKREVFVSAPDDVMVIGLHASVPGKISFGTALGGRDDYYDDCRPDDKGNIVYTGGSGSKDGISFVAVLRAVNKGGRLYNVGNSIRV